MPALFRFTLLWYRESPKSWAIQWEQFREHMKHFTRGLTFSYLEFLIPLFIIFCYISYRTSRSPSIMSYKSFIWRQMTLNDLLLPSQQRWTPAPLLMSTFLSLRYWPSSPPLLSLHSLYSSTFPSISAWAGWPLVFSLVYCRFFVNRLGSILSRCERDHK